jgi:hypothetical protein
MWHCAAENCGLRVEAKVTRCDPGRPRHQILLSVDDSKSGEENRSGS